MKKRIIQVVQHLRPGGIETMALSLLQHADETQDVHIVSLQGTKKSSCLHWPRLNNLETNLHFLHKEPGVSLSCIRRLYDLFKEMKPDVVHSHHVGPLLYAGMAARMADIQRLVHTEHDVWHLNSAKRRMLQWWLLRYLKPHLVADADVVAEKIKKVYQFSHPQVIHNGIDCEYFSPGDKIQARRKLGLPLGTKIIGCSGRLNAVKGHHYLLQAISMLDPGVSLVLAGDGPEKLALMEQATALGLGKRIIFLGHTEEMLDFYRSLDVFCMASINEGLPLAPLEAQACNIPVVLTDVGGCKEACCPDTGVLTSSGNSMSTAWGIKRQLARGNQSPREFILNNRSLTDMVSAYDQIGKGNSPC